MSNQNREILNNLIPVVNAVAETFGSRCEVVLHDLTRPNSSVIYTKNSSVTGRRIGESFRHLFNQVLRSEKFKDDYVANYKTTTTDGRVVKSTTALIKNEEGVTIGAFCINFDIDDLIKLNLSLGDMISVTEEVEIPEQEEIIDNVWKVVTDLINHAINEYPVPVSDMTKSDKMKIISFLNEKGLFLIKGAIDELAIHLQVSKVTIYGYLDQLKAAAKGGEE